MIPRVRAIANILDAAHRANVVHGALHPNKVFVTDSATYLIAGKGMQAPYAAPELLDGHGATPMSDQYALAAIAYEWLFGRPVAHGGERAVEVRAMPGVDRSALSKAFTRALSPKPEDRFASCLAFCDAMHGAIVPELPLLADVDDFSAEEELGDGPIAAAPVIDAPQPDIDDFKIIDDGVQPEPELDTFNPHLAEAPAVAEPVAPAAAPSWQAPPPPRKMEPQKFGATALILAAIVGSVFGFAAGYMARPRALQSGAPQQIVVAGDAGDKVDAGDAGEKGKAGSPASRVSPAPPASPASRVSPGSPAAAAPGRLLIRSSPSGASVTVDGVARGVTPLALRDLSFGTRDVTITRRGYISETRRVAITKARPARTLEVRLTSEAPAAAAKGRSEPPRPSTPATLGRPATTTGSLSIESRPSGASVSINGKPSGTTPLTLDDLAPGEYRILMTLKGYRNLATTVRVVAGERARAAASLTAVEQE